jgi:hypothetical protein
MLYIIGMAGRFSNRHKRYIREEDSKSKNRVVAKVIVQYCLLLVLYWAGSRSNLFFLTCRGGAR